MWKYCLLFVIVLVNEPIVAQSQKDWLGKGMHAYERQHYVEARNAFEAYLQDNGSSEKISLPLAISYYETSQLDKAYTLLSGLINSSDRPLSLLYYAKVLHSQEKFAEAAEYYKKYLSYAEQPSQIKKQILHCRSGISLNSEKGLAFIDNMGEQINTPFDEMGPVISPNFPDRIYFSSASTRSVGGRRDPNGYVNEEFGRYTYDMFRVENIKGAWNEPEPLNPELNTARHELLYDFTEEGKVAIFFRGFNLKFGDIVTDTFQMGSSSDLNKKNIFNSPANATYGDKDVHFINDSTFIFASVRPEGLGGYDLYICKWQNGIWSEPESLGPQINSPFHDRCPHFNVSGNQLFFSSDRPQGMGGYDIYIAGWKDGKYLPVKNLGKGINSPSDDLFFVNGHDNYSSFLCSDRKSGFGGFDIYSAFFRESIGAITASNGLPPFLRKTTAKVSERNSSLETRDKVEYDLSALLFSTDGEELTADHKETLNKVSLILSEHPRLELNILSFTDYEGPKKYDLYFSLKRAETVGQYLMQQGIPGERIYITACGSAYPVYIQLSENQLNPSPNQRIDFSFSSPGEMPVLIEYNPQVPIDEMENTPYQKFINLSKGLTYSVQIAASQQLYESPVLEKYKNPLIRTKAGNSLIKYTMGVFSSYDEARNLRYQLLNEGYKGAFITAYIDGIRKTRDQLRPLVDQYEGLRSYINVD